MKKTYLKPAFALIKAEATPLMDSTVTEGGTVDTATGDGSDEDGDFINLAKRHDLWSYDYDNTWDKLDDTLD